jgi:hypothetical protein
MRATGTMMALAVLTLVSATRGRAGEEAEKPFDLADHLAPDTIAYLTLDDLGAAWKAFPGTPLGRAFSDPEIQAFFVRLSGKSATQTVSNGRQGSLVLPQKGAIDEASLSKIGRVSLALTAPHSGLRAEPGVVASLNVGTERELLARTLNELLVQASQAEPTASLGRICVVDDRILELELQDTKLKYFWSKDTLIFGTHERDVAGVRASIHGKVRKTLSARLEFQRMSKETAADAGGTFLYVAPGALMDPASHSRQTLMARALGLTSIQAIGLSSRTAPDGRAISRFRLLAPVGKNGFPGILGRGKGAFRSAAYLDSRSALAATIRVNPTGAARLISRLIDVGAIRSKGTMKDGSPWVMEFARSIGSEAGISIVTPTYGLFPEVGVVILLADARRAERSLVVGLMADPGIKARPIELRGRRYYRLAQRQTTPLMTTLTFSHEAMLLGSSITVVEKMLTRAKGGKDGKDSLALSPAYGRAVKDIPDESSAVIFVDTPKLFTWGYQAAKPFVSLGLSAARAENPSDGPGLSWGDFPQAETITKHLGPAVTWIRTDADGLTAVSRSSVQGEVTVFSMTAGMAAALFMLIQAEEAEDDGVKSKPPSAEARPEIPKSHQARLGSLPKNIAEKRRRDAWRRLCHTNLAFFRYEFRKHRQRNKGRPPPDLAGFFGPGPALGPHYYSPADKQAWDEFRNGGKPKSSYVYVGSGIPREVAHPECFLLIWNREPFHAGNRMVLFLDGGIRLLDEETFQKRLKETRALLVE